MHFCTRCTALDIRLAKFISHPGTDDNSGLREPICSLGRLDEIRNNYKTCMLCRLVFAVFRSGPLKKINKINDLHHVAISPNGSMQSLSGLRLLMYHKGCTKSSSGKLDRFSNTATLRLYLANQIIFPGSPKDSVLGEALPTEP